MTTTGPQLISEPLEPQPGTFNARVMARGEPGLPCGFSWRNQKMALVEVLEHWKESGPCRHGSSERYVRKHWYKIRTGNHQIATLYFDRQTRSTSQKKRRWWLYTLEDICNPSD